MSTFTTKYHHVAFVVYVVLAFLILGTSMMVLLPIVGKDVLLVPTFVAFWLILACYWYIRFFVELAPRKKYLITVLPPLFLMFPASIFILTGFLVFLSRNNWRILGDGANNAQLVVLQLIIVLLLIIPWSVGAGKDIRRALRTRHHVDGKELRFFTPDKELIVHLKDIRSLVLGQHVVLLCNSKSEEAHALEYLNRPTQHKMWPKRLDGVLYLDNEKLVKDLLAVGCKVDEERLARIVYL